MWVATERRGWCLEVPLFPLHPNLPSPSSRPFLKLRALEPIQDTPLQPLPSRGGSASHPPSSFLPRGRVRTPALAAPELMAPAAQPEFWLTSPLPQNWPGRLVGLCLSWEGNPIRAPQLLHLLLTFCSLWTQPSHFTSPGRAWVRREEHQRGGWWHYPAEFRGKGDDTGAPAGL